MVRRASDPDPDPREQALARTMGLPDVLARVLLARGFDDPTEIRKHLRPDLRSLADPRAFRQMERAVERVRRAVQNGESILIAGDYDVDGITSTVLLLDFFSLMEADVKPFIPAREDGYSLSAATLRAVQEGGHTLLISVDNGTNAVEWVKRIQEAGCDVIVTDHHGTTDHVADAYAVLNPRLHDAGYPDRDLAGVGVAFRLATAAAERFSASKRMSEEFRNFLANAMAYVGLGTVADVAPLRGENRVMVTHGLRALAVSANPGIKALLDIAGIRNNRVPTVDDVAFRIAPVINAAGRMGSALEAVRLLTATGYAEAQEAAKVLEKHNNNRREVERQLTETVRELIAAECKTDDAAIVLGGAGWHPGVLGIVASRIAESTHKPTLLIAFPSTDATTNEDPVGRGSGRCPPGIHLRNALQECGDYLGSYGGHAAAVGLEIQRHHLEAFRTAFDDVVRRTRQPDPTRATDGLARLRDLDPRTVRKLDLLGPFGAGNSRPSFTIPGVKILANPQLDPRGVDLKVRVAQDGTILTVRLTRGAPRFEEVRAAAGRQATVVATPKLAPRGEEGPTMLLASELNLADPTG